MKSLPIEVPRETLNAIHHGPYAFHDVHAYQLTFRSDPAVVSKLVPEPLVANRRGLVSLVVAQYLGGVSTPEETIPGYDELVIGVPAKYRTPEGEELAGLYMVQLYLADRTPGSGCDPTILGLVVPGYPKRSCNWQELQRGNDRHIRVARRGEDVVGLRIVDAPLAPVSLKPASGASFLLKYIPSATEERCADVLKLNLVRGSTQLTSMAVVKVGFDGDAVRLDTGTRLPVHEVLSSMRCTMTMTPERTVELVDYLARPESSGRATHEASSLP